jgi:hypothetical protein
MQRLAIGSLLLALAQGCIIVDDTEENGGSVSCPMREDGACFAVSAVCPAEAVTLNVYTQPAGVAGAFMDEFDCADGGVVVVDPGTYDVRVEATTAEADTFFGSAPVLNQEVGDLDDVPLVFEFPTGQGFFWVNWRIVDEGGTEITCEDIAAASVEVESILTSEGTSVTDVLPCVYGGWQTRALDLGEYDVRITLLDDGGIVLDQNDPILTDLTEDTVLVELPDITFALEAPTAR